MCGILACVALLDAEAVDNETTHKRILDGLNRIKHRGPDGFGIWLDQDRGRCGESCSQSRSI
jgi:asparagine synthetase B (glutamine-hydrolysing)